MPHKPACKVLISILFFVIIYSFTLTAQTNADSCRIKFEVVNNTWCFDPITISVNDSLIFNRDISYLGFANMTLGSEGNVNITAQLGKRENTKITSTLNVARGMEYNVKIEFKNKNKPAVIQKVSETSLTNGSTIVTKTEPGQNNYYLAGTKDLIVKANGDSVFCKIDKVDSARIYFNMTQSDKEISTYIDRKQISEYKTDIPIMKAKRGLNYKGNLFCIMVDPFDFIFCGPIITGELILQGKGKDFGVGLLSGYRCVKWGWMARDLLWDGLKTSSHTIPFSLRIYSNAGTKTNGTFFGPYTEFGRLMYDEHVDEFIKGFGFEYGYKETSNGSSTFEVSAMIGRVYYGRPDNWLKFYYAAFNLRFGFTL